MFKIYRKIEATQRFISFENIIRVFVWNSDALVNLNRVPRKPWSLILQGKLSDANLDMYLTLA